MPDDEKEECKTRRRKLELTERSSMSFWSGSKACNAEQFPAMRGMQNYQEQT
jgi:hypothetical protein